MPKAAWLKGSSERVPDTHLSWGPCHILRETKDLTKPWGGLPWTQIHRRWLIYDNLVRALREQHVFARCGNGNISVFTMTPRATPSNYHS